MTKREYIKAINSIAFEIHEFYHLIKDKSEDELETIELKNISPKLFDVWRDKIQCGVSPRSELRELGKIKTILNDEFQYIGKDSTDQNHNHFIFQINGKRF